MKVLDKPAPLWFRSLTTNLNKVEANRAAYEDLEEGVVAPSQDVFTAAKAFIDSLNKYSLVDLEEPRISVSANGNLGLAFGGAKRSLDVVFTPKTHFYFKDSLIGEHSGDDCSKAIELATSYFRL